MCTNQDWIVFELSVPRNKLLGGIVSERTWQLMSTCFFSHFSSVYRLKSKNNLTAILEVLSGYPCGFLPCLTKQNLPLRKFSKVQLVL